MLCPMMLHTKFELKRSIIERKKFEAMSEDTSEDVLGNINIGKLMIIAILCHNARFLLSYNLGYRFLLTLWDSYDHYSRHLVLVYILCTVVQLLLRWCNLYASKLMPGSGKLTSLGWVYDAKCIIFFGSDMPCPKNNVYKNAKELGTWCMIRHFEKTNNVILWE